MEAPLKTEKNGKSTSSRKLSGKMSSKKPISRRSRHGASSNISQAYNSIQSDIETFPTHMFASTDCSNLWLRELKYDDYTKRSESWQSLSSIATTTLPVVSQGALGGHFIGSQGTMDGRLPDIDYRTHRMHNMEHEGRVIMEYLYVTLEKKSNEENHGLHVTFSLCDDLEGYSDVFVKKIDCESVAGRDGRIREKDQIVQINGRDILCFDQAVTMLRTAARSMNLLLVRPGFEIPSMYYEIDHPDQINEYSDVPVNQDDQKVTFSGPSEINATNSCTAFYGLHQDIESINRDFQSVRMDNKFPNRDSSRPRTLQTETATSSPLTGRRSNGSRMVPRMGTRRDSLPASPMSNPSQFTTQNVPVCQSQTTMDYNLRSAGVVFPITQHHLTNNNNTINKPVQFCAHDNFHDLDIEEGIYEQIIFPGVGTEKGIQTETSDFNFCSVPTQTTTLAPTSNGGAYSSDEQNYAPLYLTLPLLGESGDQTEPVSQEAPPSASDIYDRYSVMYTTPVNLEHTIRLQQQLFEQQLRQRNPMVLVSQANVADVKGINRHGGNGAEKKMTSDPCTDSGPKMEWVVKRRPDGTRYVTRRPTGSRILRERSRRLAAEEDASPHHTNPECAADGSGVAVSNERCKKSPHHRNLSNNTTSRQASRSSNLNSVAAETGNCPRGPGVISSRNNSPNSIRQKEGFVYQDSLQRTSPVNQLLSVTMI